MSKFFKRQSKCHVEVAAAASGASLKAQMLQRDAVMAVAVTTCALDAPRADAGCRMRLRRHWRFAGSCSS